MKEYVVTKDENHILVWFNDEIMVAFYNEETYETFVRYAMDHGDKFWLPAKAQYEELT